MTPRCIECRLRKVEEKNAFTSSTVDMKMIYVLIYAPECLNDKHLLSLCTFTGYVSRCGSDSDNSSDLDMEPLVAQVSLHKKPRHRVRSSSDPEGRKRKDKDRRRHRDEKEHMDKPREDEKEKEEKDADTEKDPLDKNKEGTNGDKEKAQDGQRIQIRISNNHLGDGGGHEGKVGGGDELPASEASDSCRSDSQVLTSPSCDSLDALEEDDLISCSSSAVHTDAPSQPPAAQLHHYPYSHTQPHLLAPPPAHSHPLIQLAAHDREGGGCRRSGDRDDPQPGSPVSPSPTHRGAEKCSGSLCSDDSSLCFAELSRLVDFLPSPPEASEEDDDDEEELRRRKVLKEMDECVWRTGEGGCVSREGSFTKHRLSPSSPSSHSAFVFNFNQGDARCYYNICSNITPDSARSLPHQMGGDQGEDCEAVKGEPGSAVDLEPIPILQPPPGFGDSSSDEEFYDARDRLTSPEDPTSGAMPRGDDYFVCEADHFQAL